jgi:protein-L-isoaspartate(D-aspartate) O-methyltransferase
MSDFNVARTNMVDCQIHPAGILLPGLLESFQTVPREKFVPENLRSIAYTDGDIPLGEGRFLLEPGVHARLIQAAEPKCTDVVLDIGGGSGYAAAIMSPLVTTVVALEDKQKLLTLATRLWDELGVCNVVGLKNKLAEGSPEHAPFDLIFMNGAVAEIPSGLVEQLSPQGRLITIVKKPGAVLGQAVIVQNLGEKRFSSYTLFEAGAQYLPGFEPQPTFTF